MTSTISVNPIPKAAIKNIKTAVDQYKKYITALDLKKEAKETLISDEFIYNVDLVYTYYPMLFNEAFGVTDKEFLNKLSLAGYFCFQSINTFDDLIDTVTPSKVFEKYIFSIQMLEESIKLLTTLFNIDAPFWNYWMLRKKEFSNAYKTSKKLDNSIKNLTDYEALANDKSAYAKLAIDSLYLISEMDNKKEIHDVLLQSQKHFSTALQVLDDIKDLSQDLTDGQFNILRLSLNKTEHKDVEQIKAFFYQSGIISNYLNYAIQQTDKAIETSREISDLPHWEFTINQVRNKLIKTRLNIDGYVKVHTVTHKSSSVRKRNATQHEQLQLTSIITTAVTYIFTHQEVSGNWLDYFNAAGLSDSWCTAFILATLPKNYFSPHHDKIQQAISFLQADAKYKNGWGYNTSWMIDPDSTSFAMLALLNTDYNIDQTILDSWFSFQKENGGFGTYKDSNAVQMSLELPALNVDGWTQSHFCVSATAYYFLAKAKKRGILFDRSKLDNLRNYLFSNNETHAYWWTDNIYAYNYLLKGAIILNDTDIIEHCIKHLKTKYLSEILLKKITQNNFYLGLLLDTICSSVLLFEEHSDVAHKLAGLLVDNQKEDGSWKGAYSLRIPFPSVIDPSSEVKEWGKGTIGTNKLFIDFHALFSTVICIKGLHNFKILTDK